MLTLGEPSTGKSSARGASARISLGGGRIDVVGVIAYLIVDFSFLRVAENVVGLGERFELLLGRLVPGIDVRMIFAGELAESFADILGRSRLLHPENVVVVFFGGGCHHLTPALCATLGGSTS